MTLNKLIVAVALITMFVLGNTIAMALVPVVKQPMKIIQKVPAFIGSKPPVHLNKEGFIVLASAIRPAKMRGQK